MKPETTANQFIISSSPHSHCGESVQRIMLDVLIALVPAMLAAFYFFGWNAVRLTLICVITSLVAEWLCRKVMHRNNTLTDLSAAITGVLLAFNLPPNLPGWMAVAGSLFAIIIAKQVFGGLGYNPFNPALAGRAFMLISFTGAMTTWSSSTWGTKLHQAATDAVAAATTPGGGIDALATATPLGYMKELLKAGKELPQFEPSLMWNLFAGNINGCIGEVSAIALLIGGVYLLLRKVITWHIPVAYIGTVLIYAFILHLVAPATSLPPLFHLLAGGVLLGAFFMATDMVTSPLTAKGMVIFGIGCGVITMLIRTVNSGSYPEGASFAILIMNAFTPLINKISRNRIFGEKKQP